MRLIDNHEGHLFALPPPNVILLAPRRLSKQLPVLLQFAALPVPRLRSFVVHGSDGAQETLVYVETAAGWRRQP